jgi:hypothetical protein
MRRLLGKPPQEIDYQALQRLVAEGDNWREGRFWDFKESVPTAPQSGKKDERREALADISSFANAEGGLLVIGVRAENGVPVALPGIPRSDLDALTLRLQALAREQLDPPLTRITPHLVTGTPEVAFLILEIPRSLVGPHAVWLNRDGRFWRRNAGGKYQMDVTELRESLLEAERWLDEAVLLRGDRIRMIAQGLYAPYAFPAGWSAIVLHAVPLGKNRPRLDMEALEPTWKEFAPDPAFFNWTYRYTIEGGLVFAHDGNERAAIVHCFRTGMVEQCVTLHNRYSVPDHGTAINGCTLQSDIGAWFEAILKWQQVAGLEPPIALFLSLLSVNGRAVVARHRWGVGTPGPAFSERDIALPEVVVSDHTIAEWSKAVAELTTFVWQAAGFSKSQCP